MLKLKIISGDKVRMKKLLPEVVVVRILLIFLLVFYHTFAIYSGAWSREYVPPTNQLYAWLDRLSYSSMLESFVFISGYIYGLQVKTGGGRIDVKWVILKKAKRLLLPSVIFSIVYLVSFGTKNLSGTSTISIMYEVLNGIAHMWFLPMLFWCFVLMTLLIPYIEKNKKIIITASICMSFLVYLPLPFRINDAFHYLPFFIMGYLAYSYYRGKLKVTKKLVLITLSVFFMAFILLSNVNQYLSELADSMLDLTLITKVIFSVLKHSNRLIYSSIGVFQIYIVMEAVRDKKLQLKSRVITLSSCCFGVYLFQQFILVYLYDYTNIPWMLNSMLLPWCFFIITLLLSVLFTQVVRMSNAGRHLI